ncbi:MAG: hypothetical protein M3Q65_11250 [Chloroflexota bacterium]|nr:hypothetical protein [Chloroflexota bacterium]
MTVGGAGGAVGKGGYRWREGDAFAELTRFGDGWQLTYGFEATLDRGRVVAGRQTTPDYEDAVRQIRQVIGYFFAEPEHAERVRRELLQRAGIDPGPSQYLPVPDAKYLTPAGGGAGAADQEAAEQERRVRILGGEPLPEPDAPTPPGQAQEEKKRPWWKRFGS